MASNFVKGKSGFLSFDNYEAGDVLYQYSASNYDGNDDNLPARQFDYQHQQRVFYLDAGNIVNENCCFLSLIAFFPVTTTPSEGLRMDELAMFSVFGVLLFVMFIALVTFITIHCVCSKELSQKR